MISGDRGLGGCAQRGEMLIFRIIGRGGGFDDNTWVKLQSVTLALVRGLDFTLSLGAVAAGKGVFGVRARQTGGRGRASGAPVVVGVAIIIVRNPDDIGITITIGVVAVIIGFDHGLDVVAMLIDETCSLELCFPAHSVAVRFRLLFLVVLLAQEEQDDDDDQENDQQPRKESATASLHPIEEAERRTSRAAFAGDP